MKRPIHVLALAAMLLSAGCGVEGRAPGRRATRRRRPSSPSGRRVLEPVWQAAGGRS